MSIGIVLHLGLAAILSTSFSVNALDIKCCQNGFLLNDNATDCVRNDDYFVYQIIVREFNTTQPFTCSQDINNTLVTGNFSTGLITSVINCVDVQKNGSLVYLDCSKFVGKTTSDYQCNSILTFLHMYGASMVVAVNIVYLFFYTPTLLLYIVVPDICRRAYDKVVFVFIVTQMVLSCVVITLGHYMLCHILLDKIAYAFFGLSLMILTISSCLWLLVISFDVASTITKFRWAPSSGAKGRDENHKFHVYCLWVFLGSIIPTAISATLQFSPIPDDNIFKPNFHILTKLNYRVIAHVTIVPVLVALASNILFIYTTVRMINIQKSTNVANENRKKSTKEKYILYLKLYLLMDAPYVTGALGAIYEDFWILKFIRVAQPILMLYAVLPRKTVSNLFQCRKKPKEEKIVNIPKITQKAAAAAIC